jgi:hypothetical protein
VPLARCHAFGPPEPADTFDLRGGEAHMAGKLVGEPASRVRPNVTMRVSSGCAGPIIHPNRARRAARFVRGPNLTVLRGAQPRHPPLWPNLRRPRGRHAHSSTDARVIAEQFGIAHVAAERVLTSIILKIEAMLAGLMPRAASAARKAATVSGAAGMGGRSRSAHHAVKRAKSF